jgi:hypothetical protein
MESQKEQGQRTGAGVGPNDGTGVGNVDAAGAKTAADFFCHPLGIFQTITVANENSLVFWVNGGLLHFVHQRPEGSPAAPCLGDIHQMAGIVHV